MTNGTTDWGIWGLFDPLEASRQMTDACMETMADAMVDFVNTDAYAKATGTMLESGLNMTAPLREMTEKLMPQVLAFYGMPSRNEVISIAEKMTNIETRLDDLEIKLDGIARAVRAS